MAVEGDIKSFSSDGLDGFVASDGVLFGYSSLMSPISWALLSSWPESVSMYTDWSGILA